MDAVTTFLWEGFRSLRLIAHRLFVQRHHADDAVKLVQHVGVIPRQVAQNGFVRHQLGKIALGQHQVEDVLTVGLLGELELLLEVAHLPLHLGHLVGADTGHLLGLGLTDEQVAGCRRNQGLGIGDRDVVGTDHQFDALNLTRWLELAQDRTKVCRKRLVAQQFGGLRADAFQQV